MSDKPYLVFDRAVPELHSGGWPYDIRVCIGTKNVVEVDKLYGPAAAQPLRISLDMTKEEWVIERQVQDDDDDNVTTWLEYARIPICKE